MPIRQPRRVALPLEPAPQPQVDVLQAATNLQFDENWQAVWNQQQPIPAGQVFVALHNWAVQAPEPVIEVTTVPQVYLPCTKRGEATPRFFIPYETTAEWQLRLMHTYVSYKDSPIYIENVTGIGREAQNPRVITAMDINNKKMTIRIPEDLDDLNCRAFQPGYIDVSLNYGKAYQLAGYLHRIPARIYRQGMSGDNSRVKCNILSTAWYISELDREKFMKALANRGKILPLSTEVIKQLEAKWMSCGASIPLSNNFALAYTQTKALHLECRGMKIANVSADAKVQRDLIPILPSALIAEAREANLL